MTKPYASALLLAALVALTACASQPPLPACSPSTSPRPTWIDSPPVDEIAHYAIGSASLIAGGDKQERSAQQSALADLAQSIEVRVDLEFQQSIAETTRADGNSSVESASVSSQRFSSELILADVKIQQRWQDPSDCKLWVLMSIAQDKATALQALQAAEYQYAIAADQAFPLQQRLQANQAASANLAQVDFLKLPSKPNIAYYQQRYSEQLALLERERARELRSQFLKLVQRVQSENSDFAAREQAYDSAQQLLQQIDFAYLSLSATEAAERLQQAWAILQAQIAANSNLVLVMHRSSFDVQLLEGVLERLRAHELSGRELKLEVQNPSAALEIARDLRAQQLQLIQIEKISQELSSHGNWSGKLQVTWRSIDLETGRQLSERTFNGITIAQDQNLLDWSKTLLEGVFREPGSAAVPGRRVNSGEAQPSGN